ncbi:carbohydrate kinase family protein [Ethanoligenens harbinense]|uniref:PfkB domain protein n=1 Tax=Ethanoligenens harbinense (strain DSM 18485 / JCM 12961 / CGMCC 1.5033 / YUAN-3) TaxID=663278 RepID=E6U348_ETHHY|nr:carbohydrate kinase [Ethanoligenens harbinense]ADU27520.1 PfkB domain protein [Ethanoligenens harbinense YUAN-3]AVQ96572.1 carbohydrate kinase [Ethanoligenens harbinense YUAN-3]AYF39233.1 carbohydrate kinase [Ethanoligenens harbinense]AYF42057.1 carbohydrate kinase [Ethanoligenens harbinense]QCN92812.1 carbohydrate kinase [Ethanoligenens harbinense]
MFDVVAIGELLIDFTPAGVGGNGAALFARNPGGAPANVLASSSRLGAKTAFIGKVGDDDFGRFLKDTLDELGIDTHNLVLTDDVHTTLAFVHLDSSGDRSFSFYRKPGADVLLREDELDLNLLRQTGILHFGSLSLTDEPARSATFKAVQTAKDAGAVISYDPNYRAPLWNSREEAVEQMKAGLAYADVVKLSEEELALLTGETDLNAGARELQKAGASLVLVTLGKKGAYYRLGDRSNILPTYDVHTIDTNGAGDAFTGAVHYGLKGKSLKELRSLSTQELETIIDYANAVGSLVTGKSGAIPAMPLREDVLDCQMKVPHLIVED